MISRTVQSRSLISPLRGSARITTKSSPAPSPAASILLGCRSDQALPRPLTPLQRRWIMAAPKPGEGPLMERRADRELPDVASVTFRWRRTFPIFVLIIAAASLAIFNYQKSSSPIVASTLYALRVSPKARNLLGDEIYFKHQIPWISGEMNQLHGRIDVSFPVRGTRGEAVMRFASYRLSHRGMFETTEWTLEMPDGKKVDLLDGTDPFRGIVGGGGGVDADDLDDDEEGGKAATRGFRQTSLK